MWMKKRKNLQKFVAKKKICCYSIPGKGSAQYRTGHGLVPLFHFREGALMASTRVRMPEGGDGQQSVQDKLQMSTAEIGLSVRTTNCLEERGIFTVADLLNCSPDDLLSISNFGEKTLEEVYLALESVGFFRKSKRKLSVV